MKNMKIPTIAIIDDGIDPSHLSKSQPCNFFIAGLDDVQPDEKPSVSYTDFTSHATACYKILKENTNAAHQLISIKVLKPETGTGTKKTLINALKWCANHGGIDIIHMSMGTSQYLDFSSITKAIKVLHNSVIIAACSNKNTLTLPACLPQVIGVRHCDVKKLQNKFTYNPTPYDGIELMTHTENASNSLAAPVVTARVCEYISQGVEGTDAIRKRLMEDSVQYTPDFQLYKGLLPFWENFAIPVITIPDHIPGGVDKLKALITAFIQDGYRAVGLTLSQKTSIEDCIFKLSWQNENISLLGLIELYYNFTWPDIIFLHMGFQKISTLPEKMQADIIIGQQTDRTSTCECLDINESAENLLIQIKGLLS